MKDPKEYAAHETALQNKWSKKRVLYTDVNPYRDPGIDCSDSPSLCDNSQAAECDINNIVAKFIRTGVLPGVNAAQVFADVSDALSYHEAMDIVLNAENQFMSLDAKTRQRFGNDPAQFMDFVHDPQNEAEMIKLGLAKAKPSPTGSEVPKPSPAAPAEVPKH